MTAVYVGTLLLSGLGGPEGRLSESISSEDEASKKHQGQASHRGISSWCLSVPCCRHFCTLLYISCTYLYLFAQLRLFRSCICCKTLPIYRPFVNKHTIQYLFCFVLTYFCFVCEKTPNVLMNLHIHKLAGLGQ